VSVSDAAVLLVGATACVTDLRSRRIPNVLTFGASAAAVLFLGVSAGWAGVLWSLEGWAVGCLFFLPWFLLGGMGAGDVKLLAALGAWVGPGSAYGWHCMRDWPAECSPSLSPPGGDTCRSC
jgi:prepilin peptidase CpaA